MLAIETKPKPRKYIIVLSINKGTEKSFRAELFGDTLKKQHLRNLERESQSGGNAEGGRGGVGGRGGGGEIKDAKERRELPFGT